MAEVDATGLVNFAPPLSYHFCLNLSAAFTLPWSDLATLFHLGNSVRSESFGLALHKLVDKMTPLKIFPIASPIAFKPIYLRNDGLHVYCAKMLLVD